MGEQPGGSQPPLLQGAAIPASRLTRTLAGNVCSNVGFMTAPFCHRAGVNHLGVHQDDEVLADSGTRADEFETHSHNQPLIIRSQREGEIARPVHGCPSPTGASYRGFVQM